MTDNYTCWCPDYEEEPGENPHSGHLVDTTAAWDVEDAAEVYAEREFHNNGEPFEKMTVKVKDLTGVTHEVEVTVDYEPVFSGSKKR